MAILCIITVWEEPCTGYKAETIKCQKRVITPTPVLTNSQCVRVGIRGVHTCEAYMDKIGKHSTERGTKQSNGPHKCLGDKGSLFLRSSQTQALTHFCPVTEYKFCCWVGIRFLPSRGHSPSQACLSPHHALPVILTGPSGKGEDEEAPY